MNSVELGNQGPLPASDLYIIYSMSNSPYQQWQSDLLDFSVRESGQPGVIVRLCSIDGGFPDLKVKPSQWGYTFIAPSKAEMGNEVIRRCVLWWKRLFRLPVHGRFHFSCLNKPYAMQAFLESNPGLDSHAKLLWLDPDMVFNRPWVPPVSTVGRGNVTGQYWWGYDPTWCGQCASARNGTLCPESDAAIMFPFCITVGDMRSIVASYGSYSAEIYQKSRDWKSEMYALVCAMKEAGLECRTISALGTCNDWPDEISNHPDSPISHYTQAIKDCQGREIWNKRSYTPQTLAAPWERPPDYRTAASLTDQRSLQMLHRFIDWQCEQMKELPVQELSV